MALTQGNVTIKLSGGTYSSWAAFWNDLGNLTGDINCCVDASAFTENVAPATVTESLNGFTIHVYPATFPTTTDGTTGARFTCNYTGAYVFPRLTGIGNLIIEGLVFIQGSSSSAYGFRFYGGLFIPTIRRCVIMGGVRGIYGPIGNLKFYNNILYNQSSASIISTSDFTGFISNNTKSGNISIDSTGLCENNLVHRISGSNYNINTTATGSNNSSYDATADDFNGVGSANNRINKTASPFVDYANDDFRLAPASDPIGNGKDLSAYFTDDFFGNTRTSWDIGAVAFVEEGGGDTGVNLIVSDLSNSSTIDSISITQTHLLLISNLSNGSTIDSIAITQNHLLSIANLSNESTINGIIIAQNHLLPFTNILNESTIDGIAITQNHSLSFADLLNSSSVDSFPITQVHNLSISDLVNDSTIEGGSTIEIIGGNEIILSISSLENNSTIDAISITQNHNLDISDLSNASSLDVITLLQAHSLIVFDLSNNSSADSITVTQAHNLALVDVYNGSATDSIAISQTHNIELSDLSNESGIDSITLSTQEIINLIIADLFNQSGVESISVTQNHNLTTHDLSSGSGIDSIAISQICNLLISDIESNCTIGDLVINQIHELTPSDLSNDSAINGLSIIVLFKSSYGEAVKIVSVITSTLNCSSNVATQYHFSSEILTQNRSISSFKIAENAKSTIKTKIQKTSKII